MSRIIVGKVFFGTLTNGFYVIEKCDKMLPPPPSPAYRFFFVLFLEVDHSWGGGVRSFARGGEILLRTRGDYHITPAIKVRHPGGSCIILPRLSLEVSIPESKKIFLKSSVIHMQVRLTSGS